MEKGSKIERINKKETHEYINIYLKHYMKVIKPIGRGSYSEVLEYKHLISNQLYAVKRIKKEVIQTKNLYNTIYLEYYIQRFLIHNHISNSVFSYFDNDFLYFGFNYNQTTSLRSYITANKKSFSMSINQIRLLSVSILLALEYLHSYYIIHRDIKPENILIDNKDCLFLNDFGISCYIKETQCFCSSGTNQYMSPEALFSEKQSFTSDYYSLGVVMYELYTGELPFRQSNIVNIFKFKNYREGEEEDEINSLNELINRLLKLNYKERLGYNGIKDIMNHEFYKRIDWNDWNDLNNKKSNDDKNINISKYSHNTGLNDIDKDEFYMRFPFVDNKIFNINTNSTLVLECIKDKIKGNQITNQILNRLLSSNK